MEQPLKLLSVETLSTEEDKLEREAIRHGVQQLGLPVILDQVDSCTTALKTLPLSAYDCIVLTTSLPHEDGFSFLKSLQNQDISVPIVVLTNNDDELCYANWIKAGASECVLKSDSLPGRLSRILYHIIRLHRAETEIELARRSKAENEARYRLLLQNASDLIVVISTDGTIRYISPSVERILGYQSEFLIEQDLFSILHPEDRPTVLSTVEAIIETPSIKQSMEFRLQHARGSWLYLSTISNNLLSDPKINGILINAREITHQKQAEVSQQFLAAASALLSSSLEYQTTLKRLARLAVTDLADWCIIDLIQTNQQYHRLTVTHRNPEIEALIWQPSRHALVIADQILGYSQVLQTGEPEVYFHIQEQHFDGSVCDSSHLKLLRPLNPHSYMCVPLLMGDQILGAITLGLSESYRFYSRSDLILAQELAQRIALAIENARLYQESQNIGDSLRQAIDVLGRQQQQLKTLQHLTNLLNQRLDNLPVLLNVMVNAVCDVIPGADFSVIGLHESHQEEVQLTTSIGISIEQLRQVSLFDPKHGYWSQLLAQGEFQWQRSIGSPNNTHIDLPASLYAIPINAAQEDCLGILAIGNWQQASAFDQEEYQLLEAFAKQAAIAISNAQMINILEEREERLAKQNEILIRQNEELEQQRQQIQRQNLKMMEAAQMKSQFLATMSHELRTPINAITGFSQLLLRQRQFQLSAQQLDMVKRILNNGNNLLDLINDILDLSKIEAGRMKLHLEEINLQRLITVTVAELDSLADQKGLQLDIAINLDNPHIINDSTRLRQILVNLLSNAIKFTEKGQVQIVAEEMKPAHLMIAVIDTGIGISPTHLEQIFHEFWQVDQTTTRKYQGTGLGLSICQRLVRLMGGQIQVESQVNQGSTFRIEVPRKVIPKPWVKHATGGIIGP